MPTKLHSFALVPLKPAAVALLPTGTVGLCRTHLIYKTAPPLMVRRACKTRAHFARSDFHFRPGFQSEMPSSRRAKFTARFYKNKNFLRTSLLLADPR